MHLMHLQYYIFMVHETMKQNRTHLTRFEAVAEKKLSMMIDIQLTGVREDSQFFSKKM